MAELSGLSAEPKTAVSPTVSIIIPTYNSADYITQALDSALAQADVGMEVIVVDDGSIDDTVVRLTAYADKIRYLYQENQGSAAARNAGLALARGEFVVFLDADDYFLPGKLADQLAVFEADPDLGLVHSGWQLVSADGSPIRDVTPWHTAPQLNLPEWLMWKPAQMGGMLFRRQWLADVGGLDPELRQAHDVDLVLRLALAGCRAGWLRRITLAYRQHTNATTRNGRQQVASIHQVLDKFFDRDDLPDVAQQMETDVRYYTALWAAWFLFRTGAIDQVGIELRLARQHTTLSAEAAAGEWTAHFARWHSEQGLSPTDLMTVWPQFQKVLLMSQDSWQQMKWLLDWWIRRWPLPERPPLTTWHVLWEITKMAVSAEKSNSLSLETMLNWWVDVWAPYCRSEESAAEGLAQFKQLSSAEIVALAQSMMTLPQGLAQTEQIHTFWHDAQKMGLVLPADRRQVTRLYLTRFGQTLLHRQWEQAWTSFISALKQGFHPQVLHAWGDFGLSSIRYWLGGTHS